MGETNKHIKRSLYAVSRVYIKRFKHDYIKSIDGEWMGYSDMSAILEKMISADTGH